MSTVVKINTALWSGVIAMVVSIGGVAIGTGKVLGTQEAQQKEIDRNTRSIEATGADLKSEVRQLRIEQRDDKAEILQAIRDYQ